jgi:RNA recognition motif-containing protein
VNKYLFLQKFEQKMDIFIRSLPFKYQEKDLTRLFEVFGAVTNATIIMDKATRQSKGFGFVVMSDDEAALIAIEALNGSDLQGRTIEVGVSMKKPTGKPVAKATEKGLTKPSKPQDGGNKIGGFRGIGKGYDKRNRKF